MADEHKSNQIRDSILLTHWDPHCYSAEADPTCIVDLALSALLHQDILIRAVDLFVNQTIAARLWRNEKDLALFKELFDNECLKVISTAPGGYKDDNLNELAVNSPITARAKDQLGRGLAGGPWQPEPWVWDLCRHLDGVVSHIQPEVVPEPDENKFAAILAKVLGERKRNKLAEMDQFKGIDDPAAEKFIEFCTEKGLWKTFLVNEKRLLPREISDREEFYRKEAYQCAEAECFKQVELQIKNLVQSVYMSLECDRADASGRFGRRLWECPLGFSSDQEETTTKDIALRLEVIPLRRSMTIMLEPGLGQALARTRDSKEFRSFLGVLDDAAPSPHQRPLENFFDLVADRFGEEAARIMVSRGNAEHYVAIASQIGYLAARTFGVTLGLSHTGTDFDPIVDHLLVHGCARVSSEMAHIIRSTLFKNALSVSVASAIDVRTVPPFGTRQKRSQL